MIHKIEGKACKNIFEKALGLMFSIKPRTLIFAFGKEQINPLHMFFVFFPIDVYFLDRYKEIIEVKKRFKPWAFYTPKKKAKYVIETEVGKLKVKLGDKISW